MLRDIDISIDRFVVLVIIFLLSACQPEEDIPSIRTGNMLAYANEEVYSNILSKNVYYNILLPSSYHSNPERDYPILYLLHGMGDDNTAWMSNGDAKGLVQQAIKEEAIPEMIVVMPDAEVTFYVNGYQDGLAYESFFQEEFIPYIESEYRVLSQRETRFISGLSMGGFGASYHAFKYPEKFAYCYSMSGALEGIGHEATPSIADVIADFEGDFSSLPDFTIDCGTSDFLVYGSNVNVHEQLDQMEFEHEYIERDGSHDWTFWKQALPMALLRIGKYLTN